jgi:hypothetical protein
VYVRGLIVFALCTAFVVSIVVVLNYETAGVGKQVQTIDTSRQTSSCSASAISCASFSIISATLHPVNYTDELGPVNYATLSLGLNASGNAPISSFKLFIGNTSVGAVQGPLQPGANRAVSLTLPATVTISSGKTYLLSVEGFYGSDSVAIWKSVEVTAS